MLYRPDAFDLKQSAEILFRYVWWLSITNRWSDEGRRLAVQGFVEAFNSGDQT